MKLVKWIVGGLFVLVVLAAAAAVTVFYGLHPKRRAPLDVQAPATPEAVERGRYLATHVTGCLGCHSEGEITKPGDPVKAGTLGGGRDFGVLPGFPGHIRAPNITPDPGHGLGKWTDGEILRAMREGVSRDGRPLFPMMPYGNFASLSDDDALAIVAYLRTLAPLPTDPGAMEVTFPTSMFIRLAPKPLDQAPPPAPPATDRLARGRWLLQMANCADCHTPSDKGRKIPGKELAGGNHFTWPTGGDLYVPNITPDPATGVGAYSDEDLLRVLNDGVNKAGKPLYMMPWPWYKGMADEDKLALIAALREVKPVKNIVPASTFKR